MTPGNEIPNPLELVKYDPDLPGMTLGKDAFGNVVATNMAIQSLATFSVEAVNLGLIKVSGGAGFLNMEAVGGIQFKGASLVSQRMGAVAVASGSKNLTSGTGGAVIDSRLNGTERIMLTYEGSGTSLGFLYVAGLAAGGFTIMTSTGLTTSKVNWVAFRDLDS